MAESKKRGEDGLSSTSSGVKKRARKVTRPAYEQDIPGSLHYEVSYMHRSVVTRVVSSTKYGMVITASTDGIVKFWKRTSTAERLEFVKSYKAHIGNIMALVMNSSSTLIASVGEDGVIKFYDVSTFDVTGMIPTTASTSEGQDPFQWSPHAAFLGTQDDLLAVAGGSSGRIHIYSSTSLSLVKVISNIHAAPVTGMVYNNTHTCMISMDKQGVLEYWDCTLLHAEASFFDYDDTHLEHDKNDKDHSAYDNIGSTATPSRNGILFTSKMDNTQLYEFMKKKTFGIALALHPSGSHFAIYGADRKIRLFEYKTGKIIVNYDERSKVYENKVSSSMDSMEYGKRAAVEREMQQTAIFTAGLPVQPNEDDDLINEPQYQLLTLQFDPTGQCILIPTILGIKVINWKRNKCVKIIGKSDASTTDLRFLSVCLCMGDAKVDRQMALARSGGSSVARGEEEEKKSDSILVTTAFQKRRLYVFSHNDPIAVAEEKEEEVQDAILKRDVLNEAPDAQDLLLASSTNNDSGNTENINQKLGKEAILRTSQGDIHIKLFPQQVPKTIENFCQHSRNGYYDNVLFHRVIKGFMIQTGDPLGDGTGGESIWGGEFEDEFVRE